MIPDDCSACEIKRAKAKVTIAFFVMVFCIVILVGLFCLPPNFLPYGNGAFDGYK